MHIGDILWRGPIRTIFDQAGDRQQCLVVRSLGGLMSIRAQWRYAGQGNDAWQDGYTTGGHTATRQDMDAADAASVAAGRAWYAQHYPQATA